MILSIETATSNCSVALHSMEGNLLFIMERNEQSIHASQLFLFIEEVMKHQSIPYSLIKAVAVSKGPGSYTGLRIGVSAAKGLCYSLGIPLLSINTLHAMAFSVLNQVSDEKALFIPMLDARRMEVYNAVYNNRFETVVATCATIIEETSFAPFASHPCYFFGDGMPKCRPLLEHQRGTFFIDDVLASAASVGKLAVQKYAASDFEDTAYFEPFYLKEFVSQSQFHKK